jgi:hypothetical protein
MSPCRPCTDMWYPLFDDIQRVRAVGDTVTTYYATMLEETDRVQGASIKICAGKISKSTLFHTRNCILRHDVRCAVVPPRETVYDVRV